MTFCCYPVTASFAPLLEWQPPLYFFQSLRGMGSYLLMPLRQLLHTGSRIIRSGCNRNTQQLSHREVTLQQTDLLASMPASYLAAFSPSQIAEHARIVARRGRRLAHAELCQSENGCLVCVVAEDRPGLLALVTDALLVHGLGIRSAQAFCRQRPDGGAEAVDFLALRPELEAASLAGFLETLTELIEEDIEASRRVSAPQSLQSTPTRVYFELEALRRNEYILLVEAPDSEGLLHAITSALYAQGARILTCQIGTEGDVARDRFELASASGQPPSGLELCDWQLAVLDALPRARSRLTPS